MINQSRDYGHYESFRNIDNKDQQSNRWNISYDNQTSRSKIEDIQLGKERIKIYNYVQNQMNPEIYQENKKMLEKFRLDAIKHRNQKVMNHLGKSPYLTQSMLPEGSSIDSSKLIQSPQKFERTPIVNNKNEIISVNPYYSPIYIPMRKNKIMQDTIYYSSQKRGSRKVNNYPSIDLSDISEQENYSKLKIKKRNRFFKREQQREAEKQQQKLDEIESMLKKLNKQLQKNTSSLIKYTDEQTFLPRNTKRKLHSQTQSYDLDSTDSLSLFRSQTRVRIQPNRNIKNHLELLKKKRNRIQFIS